MDKEKKILKNVVAIVFFIVPIIITLSFLLLFTLEIYSKLAIIIVCTLLFIEIFLLGWAIFCGYISRIKINKTGVIFRKKSKQNLVTWDEFIDFKYKYVPGRTSIDKVILIYKEGEIKINYTAGYVLNYLLEYCTDSKYLMKIQEAIEKEKKENNYL